MNMFWKLSGSASRLISLGCALIAILLVLAAGPDQEAGLFGVMLLLAIISSILWTFADWVGRKPAPTSRSQIPGQVSSRL